MVTFSTVNEMAPPTEKEEASRVSVAVALMPRARAVVENIRRDTGVSQTEALIRILEFFGNLDESLRFAILNRDAKTRDRLLRDAMINMAAKDAGFADLAQFVKQIDERLAQLIQAQSTGPAATDVELDDTIPPGKRRPKQPEPARRQPR